MGVSILTLVASGGVAISLVPLCEFTFCGGNNNLGGWTGSGAFRLGDSPKSPVNSSKTMAPVLWAIWNLG